MVRPQKLMGLNLFFFCSFKWRARFFFFFLLAADLVLVWCSLALPSVGSSDSFSSPPVLLAPSLASTVFGTRLSFYPTQSSAGGPGRGVVQQKSHLCWLNASRANFANQTADRVHGARFSSDCPSILFVFPLSYLLLSFSFSFLFLPCSISLLVTLLLFFSSSLVPLSLLLLLHHPLLLYVTLVPCTTLFSTALHPPRRRRSLVVKLSIIPYLPRSSHPRSP